MGIFRELRFSSISGTSPQYLSELFQPYTPGRQLQSASDTRTLVIPSVSLIAKELTQPLYTLVTQREGTD